MTAITHTTNIHRAGHHTGRVRLSANIDGDKGRLVWVEVYGADGTLQACGPTAKLAPTWAQDRIQLHSSQMFDGSMYWRRAELAS